MFAGRLKLGLKRKDSLTTKPAKLTIAHELENIENARKPHPEPIENKEPVKCTPTIQLHSPRFNSHQISTTAPFSLNHHNLAPTQIHRPIAHIPNTLMNLQTNYQPNTTPLYTISQTSQTSQSLNAINTQISTPIPIIAKSPICQSIAVNTKTPILSIISAASQIYKPEPAPSKDLFITAFINTGSQTQSIQNDQSKSSLMEELKQKIEVLTQQNDRLKNREKVLEAKLLNSDEAHYQKGINRLQAENENLQIQAIELNHKLQLVANQRKQMDNTMKKRGEEMKNYMKQLEKERMSVVDLKSQVLEKDRYFKTIMEEGEKSNMVLSNSYDHLSRQHMNCDLLLKEKVNALDSQSKQLEMLMNRHRETEGKLVGMKRSYEQQLAQRERRIYMLEGEIVQLNNSAGQTIERLNRDIFHLRNDRERETMMSNREQEIKSGRDIIDRQAQIARFDQEIKECRLALSERDRVIESLEQKLKEYYSPEQYCNLEKRQKDIEEKRLSSAKYYEAKLLTLQKENQKFRLEKLNARENTPQCQQNISESSHSQYADGFNEMLRRNISEISNLKEQLVKQVESGQAIKEQMIQVKLREKTYLNQMDILSKKVESLSKNCNIELEVEKQKFRNEIESLQRKMSTVQTRLEYKISETKQKDDFIKNTIIGRSRPEDVPYIVAELERIFLQKERLQITNKLQ